MSFWGQMNLLDPASVIQSEMLLFHDHAMVLLVGILSFVLFMGVKISLNTLSQRTLLGAQRLEALWTVVPGLLLIWLALPSLRLLYLLDENNSSGFIIKATGHQWYWSYEIPGVSVEPFDAYMVPEGELSPGEYRLLEVDNRLPVPYNTPVSVMVTSAGVLHAWTVPSLGMKMDAVPGRLNSMATNINVPGVYYGQCSEICGAHHSFMPIVVETASLEDLLSL
uniref:Cytochrome c oxidase subunit 2 n=1 Tax=Myosotella myosotis TaxID=252580 RepID=B3DFF1_9EUPU|nr:cytochrome c oxidase subunit II [Myosotella myosotis]ACE62838.1 cytochrome c oxidase subunit II [Myosotella myosotis]